MTLHVEEVKGVNAAFQQCQPVHTSTVITAQIRIILALILRGSVLNRPSPINVIIQMDFRQSRCMGAANVQHQLAIDKEVYIIVALELEEQILFILEKAIAANGKMIVTGLITTVFLDSGRINIVGRVALACFRTIAAGR